MYRVSGAILGKREIACTSCKALNRIGSYGIASFPQCGRCRATLPEAKLRKAIRAIFRFRRFAGITVIAGFIALAVWRSSQKETASVFVTRKEAIPVSCTALKRPKTGIYRNYDLSADLVAPFEIHTAAGANYFIKLEDSATQLPIQTFFIRGGQTMEANVPLGQFLLKYATGDAWCGENDLFGNQTQFNKTDAVLRFARQESPGGYTMIGHTVELILQISGNLKSSRISRETF
jgi:hypothetical protein